MKFELSCSTEIFVTTFLVRLQITHIIKGHLMKENPDEFHDFRLDFHTKSYRHWYLFDYRELNEDQLYFISLEISKTIV